MLYKLFWTFYFVCGLNTWFRLFILSVTFTLGFRREWKTDSRAVTSHHSLHLWPASWIFLDSANLVLAIIYKWCFSHLHLWGVQKTWNTSEIQKHIWTLTKPWFLDFWSNILVLTSWEFHWIVNLHESKSFFSTLYLLLCTLQ